MIQTSYIPSEHPYVAIYHKGRLGLQMGTLLVLNDTTDEIKDACKSSIKKEYHPVVTYYSIKEKKKIKQIYVAGEFKDMDVWWDVELKDIMIIGVEGGKIEWDEFFDELAPKIKNDAESAPPEKCNIGPEYHHQVLNFLQTLKKYNIGLEVPKGETFEVDAYLYTEITDGLRWCKTDDTDRVILKCTWDGQDEDDVFDALLRQMAFYTSIGLYLNKEILINLIAADEDESINNSLERIAKKLNDIQKEKGGAIFYPLYKVSGNLYEKDIDDGIKIKAKGIFHYWDNESQKEFLKECISLLCTTRKTDGTYYFKDSVDWIGIYLVITKDLELKLKKNDFYTYAADITPDNFPVKGRITNRTMTNFATYTDKNNIGQFRRTQEVRNAFLKIVKVHAIY